VHCIATSTKHQPCRNQADVKHRVCFHAC
jgi:hypothetical protein